jgi:hypothetical protein
MLQNIFQVLVWQSENTKRGIYCLFTSIKGQGEHKKRLHNFATIFFLAPLLLKINILLLDNLFSKDWK